MAYCPKCGGFGILPDGTPCDCKVNDDYLFSEVVCTNIPIPYQGMNFIASQVPTDLGETYVSFLNKLHADIISGKFRFQNLLIASPARHAKTVFVYTTIQQLYRKGIPTFPLYDVSELGRMMSDMDLGKKQSYTVENPEQILTVPYLFARIPQILNFGVFDTIALLIDRRVRRGGSTIFVYNGTWELLTYSDQHNILKPMLGDGTFNTIKNSTWRSKKS